MVGLVAIYALRDHARGVALASIDGVRISCHDGSIQDWVAVHHFTMLGRDGLQRLCQRVWSVCSPSTPPWGKHGT